MPCPSVWQKSALAFIVLCWYLLYATHCKSRNVCVCVGGGGLSRRPIITEKDFGEIKGYSKCRVTPVYSTGHACIDGNI